jgi:rubrerythrin
MIWQRVDELEALRIAIQSEIDSYHMYQQAIRHVQDKQGKELLLALAQEEKRHRQELEKEYARISGKRLLYINLPKKRRFLKEITPSATPLEILTIAIEQEEESLRFFETAAQRTSDLGGKRVFEHLAQEERHHMEMLEAEYRIRTKIEEGELLSVAKG